MKTITSFSLLVALSAAGLTSGVLAQTSSPATATPSPEISATAPLPTPNEIVYVPRLPTPADITKGAQAKSVSVERISQTNSQVDVVYRTADGKVDTTSYRLLADAGTTTGPVPVSSSGVAVPSSPAPAVAIAGTTTPSTVVYTPAPATRVYYYPDYYSDYPGYWYPPGLLRNWLRLPKLWLLRLPRWLSNRVSRRFSRWLPRRRLAPLRTDLIGWFV